MEPGEAAPLVAGQLAALAAKPIPQPSYDAAMAPVAAADLHAMLDHDLAQALKTGQLAPETKMGVTIGIVDHGVRHVFSYGTAN